MFPSLKATMNHKNCTRFTTPSLICERFNYSTWKKESYCFPTCQEMSGLDPEFGIKMMEIKVAEMNATLS